MPIFVMSMTASVPVLPDGSPDFDPYAFRRGLSELFDTDPEDIVLNISIVVVARDSRVLTAVHAAANDMFNVTILRVSSVFETCDVTDSSNETISMQDFNATEYALSLYQDPIVIYKNRTEFATEYSEELIYIVIVVPTALCCCLGLLFWRFRRKLKQMRKNMLAMLAKQAEEAQEAQLKLRRQASTLRKQVNRQAGAVADGQPLL